MALYSELYSHKSSNLYSIPFEYLDRADVKVSVNGVDTTDAASTHTFTFANDTQISLSPNDASGINANGVRIYRETNTDQLDVTFFPGSAIRAADLNKNFEQNNFATQEVKERFLDRTGGEMEGTLDMGGYRIINGADPVDLTDLATKGYVGSQSWGAGQTPNVNDVTFTGTTGVDNLTVAGTATFSDDVTIAGDVTINSTGYLKLPVGTTLERPGTAAVGMVRFNSTTGKFEGSPDGTNWSLLGGGATGGGSDTVFVETGQLISEDYTLTTGPTKAEKRNAISAGPVEIASGKVVEVPAGQSWVIV